MNTIDCRVGVCSSPVHCAETGKCFSTPIPKQVDVEPMVYHLKQYGDVSKAELDYYIKNKTLAGFKKEQDHV